jgi:streptogramin lyase
MDTNRAGSSGFPEKLKILCKVRALKFVFQGNMTDSTNFKGQGFTGKTFAACMVAGMTFLATLNAADFDVIVADSQATVYALNPRTQKRTIIAQQDKLSCPYDVATDNNGNIVVSDTGTMRIVRVNPATGQQTVLADLVENPALGVPFGIDVDGRGRIFVANSSVIVCLNKGKVEPLPKGLLQVPLDVTVGPDGHLYVADAGAGLVRINLNTKRQTVIAGIGGTSLLQQPTGIAVDGNTAYVVDGGGHSVVAVDLATRTQTTVSDLLTTPVGIALVPDGSIMVSDPDACDLNGGIFTIGADGIPNEVARGYDDLVNARGIVLVPALQ